MELIKRILPMALIIVIAICAYIMGIMDYLKWDQFKSHYDYFVRWVDLHFWESSAVFIGTYIFITACSIPVALLMTFLSGILFPQPYSTFYAVIGMTFGGSIAFLAARTALVDSMRANTGWFVSKTKEGFKENAFAYMLFLRMVPIFPYQLVNLAPAFCNVPFKTFFWGSFLGYLPVAFILTQVGRGLGALLDQTKDLSLNTVLPLNAQLALIGLSIFALMLLLLQKYKRRHSHLND